MMVSERLHVTSRVLASNVGLTMKNSFMKRKDNIKFHFIRSPYGVISGIAFEEDGDIVASFKLEDQKDQIDINGTSWSYLTFTMISGVLWKQIYNIIDEVLQRLGEKSSRSQTSKVGRFQFCWRIPKNRAREVIEEVEKALEKRE